MPGTQLPAAPQTQVATESAPIVEENLRVEEEPPTRQPPVETEPSAPRQTTAEQVPTLSLEEASRRIGPEALQVLKERFNGKLTIARYPDARDRLFDNS